MSKRPAFANGQKIQRLKAKTDGTNQWLRAETEAYHLLHQRYPVGRQSKDVVDNMYTRIEKAMIWILYGEVYVHCISMKESLINRLKVKIGVQANA